MKGWYEVEIDNIEEQLLCIFPKIYYGIDFLNDKDYHEINI